ncbi:LOW QUALITY PROTEIN: protein suppressor of white apricot [Drosophila obscura]|uniref:LOW QUALITY PROTEIN: protein suppressor of white apricot n=1 Tax=Drosophila obscura TaxID=7282 RepID=UPI001BB1DB34|nr:LOW QUALITY PROTEIN: protein suppressor of white apricot [Drosophila obscura]
MMPYNVRSAGGGSLGGILRKTGAAAVAPGGLSAGASNGNGATILDARQPPLELLVFGYACKIFRDDEKARELDHGKQLIPWMGDVNLKIDRYDVRGALCDLAPYEAPPGGYGNRLEYLSAEEQRAEQLCEEERYLFLYNNEEELRLQQEEDLKRLQQETSGGNYSQVDFQYDGQGVAYAAAAGAGAASSTTVPPSLSPGTAEENELPFVLPRTLLLPLPPGMLVPETMKQHAIIEKTARFIAYQGTQMEILIKAKQSNNSQFDFLTQGGHLQPYYRHLLAAIKQAKYAPTPESSTNTEAEPGSGSGLESQGQRTGTSTPGQVVIMVPTIKYKPSANCAYTQLISKIKGVPLQTVLDDELSTTNSQHSGGTASPTPSCRSEGHSQQGEFTPVLIRYNGSTFTHEAEEVDSPVPEEENANDGPPQVELLKNTSALALAQNYSSESEDEPGDEATTATEKEKEKEAEKEPPAPEPVLTFPVPDESLRTIIDKTATYVIKNGRQFEETLRTKSVERFGFLLPQNEFYPYYLYKVTNDVDAASKEEKTRKAAAVAAALMSKKGLSFGGAAAAAGNAADKAPVCFSIRGRDEHGPLSAALTQEASDEDEIKAGAAAAGSAEPVRGMPDRVQRAIKQVETQLLVRSQRAAPISPQKERQAEERVKDKLALIARDKLNGMVSKEKQLQLERKRKATAFLNQIKGVSAGAVASSAVTSAKATPSEEAGAAAAGDSDNESNESVRSIPITYFGPDDDEDEEEEQKQKEKPENDSQQDDDEEEEEDGGDLEKYNLLNDDSTNTFTSKPPPPPPPVQTAAAPPKPIASAPASAVLLSDDDDVQLVPAASPAPRGTSRTSRHRKTHRRSRSRSVSASSSESSRSSSRRKRRRAVEEVSASARKQRRRRSQSRTSTRSQRVRQSQPQSHRQKQRSRSRHRSRSPRRRRSPIRSRSRSRSSRSRSRSSSSRKDRRQRQQREESRHNQRRSPKKSHKRHKRRRRSSSP